jgi:hypothetical protein
MSFSILTELLKLEDLTGADIAHIKRIARNHGVMRYVLVWLENNEEITAFHRHAIEEVK